MPARTFAPVTGTRANRLFKRQKWIPAFAGMTVVHLAKVPHFDFFTRSFAGKTPRCVRWRCLSLRVKAEACPASCAGTPFSSWNERNRWI